MRPIGPGGHRSATVIPTPRAESLLVRWGSRRPSGFPGRPIPGSAEASASSFCLDLLCRGSRLAKHYCAESGHCLRPHCFHAASLGAPTLPAPSPPPPGRGSLLTCLSPPQESGSYKPGALQMKCNALWDVCKSGAFAVGVCGRVGRAGPAAGGVDADEEGLGKCAQRPPGSCPPP